MTAWERFWDAALDVAGRMAARPRVFGGGLPETGLDPVQRLTLEAEGGDADGFDESWAAMMSYRAPGKDGAAEAENEDKEAECRETEEKGA